MNEGSAYLIQILHAAMIAPRQRRIGVSDET